MLAFANGSRLRRREERRLRALAAARPGEDIGSFARGFDRRAEPFDPWVVRATWDALQPWCVFPGGVVPLRPTDRLDQEVLVDWEDLYDVVGEVAERAGYVLDDMAASMAANPVALDLTRATVGDVVRFVSQLPSREELL